MSDTIPVATNIPGATSPTPAPEGRGRSAAAFRALRHRNFRLFFSGQLISLVGTWMQVVAQSWLIYRLTGSSLLLGTLGFLSQIPIFLLSPLGGFAADRWSRQRVVISTQIASMVLAFILAILTLTKHISIWEIMVLATLLGVVNAFDVPARQSFFIEMVGRDDLLNAIALNSSMFNGARVAGPAIAGFLVARIGEGWCFFANGASYLAVIAGLLMMRVDSVSRIEHSGSPIEDVKEGFRFVRHTTPIRALILLVSLVSLVSLPFTVLMPIFADRILHGGPSAYGSLMGAIGGGAVVGALMLAMRQELRGLGNVVAYAAMGFSVTLILFGASRWYWMSLVVLVPCGFSMMLQFGATNTLIQAMVPNRLRGRVMSVYSMMFLGVAPVGSLFAGAIAERIGAPWTVALGGAASLIGAVIFLRKWPSLRAPARELVALQGMSRTVTATDVSAPTS